MARNEVNIHNMGDKDIFVIINPKASKGRAGGKAGEIERLFRKAGRNVFIAFTKAQGHAEELALSASRDGYDTIVAAGGDGCVNEVINGMMRYDNPLKPKLGIIPVGRGNDYAWAIGVPNDIGKAVDLIVSGVGAFVDVGVVRRLEKNSEQYFLNGNGYGFEPLVNFKAMEFKRVNGMASYVLGFIKIFFSPPKPYSIHLETKEESVDISTQQISVCIGQRMGSAFILAPQAKVDDGYFDLMYTKRPFTRFSLLLAVIWFLSGRHLEHKKFFCGYRTKSVKIRSLRAEVASHADGEIVAYMDGKDFDVDLIPAAVYVFRAHSCNR